MVRRVGFPSELGCVEFEEVFFDPIHAIPDAWLPRGRWSAGGVALHTFCDDYRQEFFWRRPFEGLIVASAARVCTAPDFTVWSDDPSEWASYQVWRSATIAAFWQRHGVSVLPVVTFAGRPEKYVKAGSAWAVRGPSRGVDRDKWLDSLASWSAFAFPGLLVVFGNSIPDGVVSCPVVRRSLFSSKYIAAQKEVLQDGR